MERMKQTNITAFLVALLVIMTQSAGAWGAVGVGRDDDHESGLISIGACITAHDALASTASDFVERCVASNDDFQADEITTDELFLGTCVGVFIGSSTNMNQDVYIRTDSDSDTAISMAQSACEQDHTTCVEVPTICDPGSNVVPTTPPLLVSPGFMAPVTNPQVSLTSTTATSSSSSSGTGLAIAGGVVVAGLAVWYFTSDSSGDLEWTPSYAFNNNNGNMSYSVGNRWTATADNYRIYWQTRQNGNQFVYGSGIRYNGNILSATMNSESAGKQTDLDLALSANKTVGLWNFGGGYQFDMQLSDAATETQNRLNAKIGYVMNKWILSANANTDGDNSAARIGYSYRF